MEILFTYKGDSQFSTFFGGFVSIAILSAVGVYLSILIQIMVNRDNSNNNTSTKMINLNSDNTQYHLSSDYGFSFGVSITDIKGKVIELDPTIFNLVIIRIIYIESNS